MQKPKVVAAVIGVAAGVGLGFSVAGFPFSEVQRHALLIGESLVGLVGPMVVLACVCALVLLLLKASEFCARWGDRLLLKVKERGRAS